MTSVDTDELYEALSKFIGLEAGDPSAARDPVNEPMIRHWCDAMGDDNPVYTDPGFAAASVHAGIVAPPTMLQAWNMRGLKRPKVEVGAQSQVIALLDEAGFTSVVATNCDQEYLRYLRPGDLLTESGVIEDISTLKQTALGAGYFVTTLRTYRDQAGEVVGTMRFRILKYRPAPADQAAAVTGPPPTSADTAPAGDRPWPHPAVNSDTAFFWEGTAAGELRIQRCSSCSTLRHPPSPGCVSCGSLEWDHVVSRGRGTVYSYVVHHHPPVPPLQAPFVVALVELDEGTRLVGNLLVDDPAEVTVGLPVEVEFVAVADDLVLPQWRIAG